jgi:hypothetical protein
MTTCAVRSVSLSAPRSQPVLGPSAIGLDRVVGALLDVMPGGCNDYLEHPDDAHVLQPPPALSHHAQLVSRGGDR